MEGTVGVISPSHLAIIRLFYETAILQDCKTELPRVSE